MKMGLREGACYLGGYSESAEVVLDWRQGGRPPQVNHDSWPFDINGAAVGA